MVNTKKRGQKRELEAEKILKKQGYTVFFRSQTVKRGPFWHANDFADYFDLVAAKTRHTLHPIWKFISVKSSTQGHGKHKKQLKEWERAYWFMGLKVELWVWHKRRYDKKRKEWIEPHFKVETI